MLREQIFSDISRYAKKINPEYAAQIAEHKEKVGFVDLDDPNAPKRKVPRTDAQLRELEGIERAKAEARAQAEHLAALARLEDGTAIHRQKSEKNKVLRKARAIKKSKPKVAKEVAKPAKQLAKAAIPAKAAKKPKAMKLPKAVKPAISKPLSSHQASKIRRTEMLELLRAGKRIPMQPKASKKGEFDFYQQQKNGLERIEADTGLKILRVNRIKDNQSFYTLDNFERHQMAKKVSGNLNTDDRKCLIGAIASGEMVRIEDVERGVAVGGSSMCILSRKHGMNIYTVFSSHYLIGWVLIDEAEAGESKAKNESEISDLGDMLQALDYLKVRKEVAARMVGATPNEILEAAYREFKRVAKDAGSTVSEVLAVKESQ